MITINADRVVITHLNADGTYTASSHMGNAMYNRCFFITGNPNMVSQEHVGRHALLLSLDNQHFILGYYIDEYEQAGHKIYVDGENIFKMGEFKAFILGDHGYIGVYHVERMEDGTLRKTPKLEYSADDEMYVTFSTMLSTMADSSVSHEITKDMLGYNRSTFLMKGNNVDKGYRARTEISGSPLGMEALFELDITPGGIRDIPVTPIPTQPASLSFASGPVLPLKLIYALASIPNTSIKIDKDGSVTIKTGQGLSGPSITLAPASPDAVVIANDVAGTAKITIKKTGSIEIDAKAGYEIKGKSVGLLSTLIAFVEDYMGHTHPASGGPTGTPTLPAGIKTKIKLSTMKG